MLKKNKELDDPYAKVRREVPPPNYIMDDVKYKRKSKEVITDDLFEELEEMGLTNIEILK